MSTNEVKDTSDSMELEVQTSNHPITDLPPKMQRFIQLYMTGQYSLSKLAMLLEVHPNTLGKWLRRKDVRDIIADMQQATQDVVNMQLKALTLKAVNKLSALTDSPIDGVALQAVKDILDRAGHKPKQEIKVDKTVRTYEEKLNDIIKETIDVTDYQVREE